MTTMHAVRIHTYGGQDVLRYEAAPCPTLTPADVLVRVHAAEVNPVDWAVRAGYMAGWFPHTLPLILGWDVAGVIEAVGANVTEFGTASSHNLAFLCELGADEALDYNATHFEKVVAGVDVVLDTIGGETQERSWGVLKPNGRLVALVQPPSPEKAAAYGVQACMIGTQPNAEQLTQVAGLVERGQLKPVISTVLPLQEVRQAHALSESRHTCGKIVLRVTE